MRFREILESFRRDLYRAMVEAEGGQTVSLPGTEIAYVRAAQVIWYLTDRRKRAKGA